MIEIINTEILYVGLFHMPTFLGFQTKYGLFSFLPIITFKLYSFLIFDAM